MAFESAFVLSSLLCSANSTTQVPALLRIYNCARFQRTSKVDELSRMSLDYLKMLDGLSKSSGIAGCGNVGRVRAQCSRWWIR